MFSTESRSAAGAALPLDCRQHTQTQRLLGQFATVDLAELNSVALLERTDTKYVLSLGQLQGALTQIREHYAVLEIQSLRQHPYETLYFDTDNFALYLSHHAGRSVRYKVRSRQYVETHQSFLEVKRKTPNSRTQKQRIATEAFVRDLDAEAEDLVSAWLPFDPQVLEPKLWNSFTRVTLAGLQHRERLTIDLDLRFGNDHRAINLPGVVVAEVKQDGVQRQTPFIQQMRAAHIHQQSFSKYCMGVSLLYPSVKHNNFKPHLRLLAALMKAETHVERFA